MAKLLTSKNNLVAGKESYYNGVIYLKGTGAITIGSYCAFGDNLRIIAGNSHNYNYPAIQVSFYKKNFPGKYPGYIEPVGVTIGSDVWIGDNCTILDGTSIGDGCCIAAGAVVKGNVAPYTIIGGIPAKTIKDRFCDNVKELLIDLEWWSWDKDKIQENELFFKTDISGMTKKEIIKLLK